MHGVAWSRTQKNPRWSPKKGAAPLRCKVPKTGPQSIPRRVVREGSWLGKTGGRWGRGPPKAAREAPQRGEKKHWGRGLCPKERRLPVPRTRRVTHRQVHAHFGSVEQEDTAVKGGLGSS